MSVNSLGSISLLFSTIRNVFMFKGSQASVWLMATNWQMMIDSWSIQLNIDLKFRWTVTNARRFSLIGQFHILWSLIGTGKAKNTGVRLVKVRLACANERLMNCPAPHFFSSLPLWISCTHCTLPRSSVQLDARRDCLSKDWIWNHRKSLDCLQKVFSCPGSSVPDLGGWLTATLEFQHK